MEIPINDGRKLLNDFDLKDRHVTNSNQRWLQKVVSMSILQWVSI
jgi:hypothetical protein